MRAHAGSGCKSADERKGGDERVHQHEAGAWGAQAEGPSLGQAAVQHESNVSGGLFMDRWSPAKSNPGSGAAGKHGSGSVGEPEQSAEQSESECGSQMQTAGELLDVQVMSGVDKIGQPHPPGGKSGTGQASGYGQVSQAVSKGQSRLRQMQAEVQRVTGILAGLLAELQQNR